MAGNKQTGLVEEGSGTKEPAGGHAVLPREKKLWSGKIVSFCGSPFFSFFSGVHGLVGFSLHYVKLDEPGQGDGEQDGERGEPPEKIAEGPVRCGAVQCMWSLNNETWCYPRYPCAAQVQRSVGRISRQGGRGSRRVCIAHAGARRTDKEELGKLGRSSQRCGASRRQADKSEGEGDMGFLAAAMGNCKIQSQACRSARSPLKSCPSLSIQRI